jgi:hypothetical protein
VWHSNEFQTNVVGDTNTEIQRHVNDLVDWIVERNSREWRNITEYIRARIAGKTLVGEVSHPFEYNRRQLLESIGAPVQNVVVGVDQEETRKLQEVVCCCVVHHTHTHTHH